MGKRKQRPPLSEAQMEIMNVIWERGETTVGVVWEAVSERRDVSRNTVQTMMMRLKEKGWLKHRTVGQTFLYQASQPRSKTLRGVVESLVDNAFNGSAEGLVLALLEGRGLSREETDRVREMIEGAEEQKRGGGS